MGQQQISVIWAREASGPRNTRYICSNDLSSGLASPFISGIPSSALCNDPATKGRMTFSFSHILLQIQPQTFIYVELKVLC